jgi:zinc protease
LRTTPVGSEELEKAKTLLRAGFIRDRQTTAGRAEVLHHYDRFHGSLAEINTDLARYLAVTAEDVQRVATKYLDPENLVDVIIVPPGRKADRAGGGE